MIVNMKSNDDCWFENHENNWNWSKKHNDDDDFIFDRSDVRKWNDRQKTFSLYFDKIFNVISLKVVQILKKHAYFF